MQPALQSISMMRGATALGSAICPGVGTVVELVVEGMVNFFIDYSSEVIF